MKLIILTGVSGAGKDYLIKHLIKVGLGRSLVLRRSFSDQLREVATGIFPWLPNQQDQNFKNNPFEHKSNDHNLSPRSIWKKVASTLRSIQDDIFAERLISNLELNIDQAAEDDNTVFVISDLRSWPEFNACNRIKALNKIDVKYIRIYDPEVTKENCEPIDRDTFDFIVDHTFTNYKTPECLVDFHDLITKIYSGEI